ncbi:MAG: Gfo/Idh/MocA family protein, partial [Vulcanimicrobiaceae bacterium]
EFRFVPPVVAIRQLIANGHLGPLREIEVNWMTTWLRAGGDRPNSWWFERARGGGQTGALLSHLIDLASHIAGRYPVRTTGIERTANPQRSAGGESFSSDVADGAFAILDFGEGLVARLGADGTRVVESALVAVHGEMRTAVTSGPRITAMRTFTVDEDETSELEIKPSAHANLAAAHPNLPAFVDLLDQFVRALDGEPAEIPTFADGVATQRALAAIGYGA